MDALDAHFVAASRILASKSGSRAVVDGRDGIELGAAGAGGAPFNPGWVVAPPAAPRETVEWARDSLHATGVGFSIHVAEPFLDAVAPALDAAGMRRAASMPGMVRPATAEEPPLPPGLRVEPVRDEAALEAHVVAVSRGFGAPDADGARAVLLPGLLDDERVAMFNGYVDGEDEPCATSVSVVAEGLAGLYAVTCHEHVRRRGIGAAMTLVAAAAAARNGAATAVLQASDMGEPVYRRIGFETVRTYHRYDPC